MKTVQTNLFQIDSASRATALQTAAEALNRGGLVVFPTETVYGIGCNALDVDAVRRLYAAKNRPAEKPLLLHLHAMEQAEQVAVLDARVRLLLHRFTPGPLSVILPKRSCVPDVVTSGGATVGLRFPSHPLFLELARMVKFPIAATSANLSGSVSAKDGAAAEILEGRADVILEDGICEFSLESTVLSLLAERPKILRQGALSRECLEEVLGACD